MSRETIVKCDICQQREYDAGTEVVTVVVMLNNVGAFVGTEMLRFEGDVCRQCFVDLRSHISDLFNPARNGFAR